MGSAQSVPAAFELTVVGGHELLSWKGSTQPQPSSPDGWGEVEAFDLAVGAADAAVSRTTGRVGDSRVPDVIQNRRLPIFRATIVTSVRRLSAALDSCQLGDFGFAATRVWMGPGGLCLGGQVTVGNREAPFTIRIATELRAGGRRRLRVILADVRLFAHLPLPAPLVGAAVARAIGGAIGASSAAVRVHGPLVDIDPLEPALLPALVERGWRLPDLRRAWLESMNLSGEDVRLQFESEGTPTEKVTTLDQGASASTMSLLEGELLPESLAAAEERLFAGDLVAADAAYRAALADAPDDLATRARLLALCAASGAPDAAPLAATLVARWPDFLPGVLYAATGALEAGDPASAAELFDRAAMLAADRGESEDAELARAAAASARQQTSATRVSVPPEPTIGQPPAVAPLLAPLDSQTTLVDLTDFAIARGDLAEADALFSRRLTVVQNEAEFAALSAERARVQLMGPAGASAALATLRDLPLGSTPEEGLVLRADLAERVGDLADARETIAELVTRATAVGDMARVRELSAHQNEMLGLSPEDPSHDTMSAIPAASSSGESASVTARTEAVYAQQPDADVRAEALGTLLHGFEQLPPERQHSAYTSFGRVAESTGDLEHAEEAYWRATRVEGDPARRANDLMAHARILLSRGNSAAAVAEWEEALSVSPEHAGVLTLLADQAYQARDWDRARGLYARLDRAPDAAESITRETLMLRRATLARAAGDGEEAAICFRELAILNPRHIEARQALAEIALDRHEFGVAAQRLEEVLRLLPLDALESVLEVRQRLAEVYVEIGDWEAARYFIELVLAQDSGRLSMLERLVDVTSHMGLHEAAADACNHLARLHVQPRKRAEALFRRGEILRASLGDEGGAFDAYLKSSDLDPTFAATALRLIDGYWRRGHFSDAAAVGDDLRRAGTLPAMDASVRLRLAMATALARGDAVRGHAAADLAAIPWNAEAGAMALAEATDCLSDRAPHDIEPAVAVLQVWHGDRNTGPLEEILRARVAANPAGPGLAPALAWLTERKGNTIPAQVPTTPDEDAGA